MGESRQEADRVMSQAIIEFLILNIPILGTLKDKELMVIEKYLNFIELLLLSFSICCFVPKQYSAFSPLFSQSRA